MIIPVLEEFVMSVMAGVPYISHNKLCVLINSVMGTQLVNAAQVIEELVQTGKLVEVSYDDNKAIYFHFKAQPRLR